MHHNLLFTRSLILCILFSTVVRAAVVFKLVILGTSFLISFILAWSVVLVAKLVISGFLSSIFLILALYKSFLTSFFNASLNLLKSTETGTNLSTSNLSSLLFKLLKFLGTFFSLSVFNLSTSNFKLAKSVFF